MDQRFHVKVHRLRDVVNAPNPGRVGQFLPQSGNPFSAVGDISTNAQICQPDIQSGVGCL